MVSALKALILLATTGLALATGLSASHQDRSSILSSYRLVRITNGITSDGFAFSENTYEAPDGGTLYATIVHYDSAARVEQEFEHEIQTATKIIESVSKFGEAEHPEQKALIMRNDDNSEGPVAVLVITAGSTIRYLRSKSLPDVQAVADTLKGPGDAQRLP